MRSTHINAHGTLSTRFVTTSTLITTPSPHIPFRFPLTVPRTSRKSSTINGVADNPGKTNQRTENGSIIKQNQFKISYQKSRVRTHVSARLPTFQPKHKCEGNNIKPVTCLHHHSHSVWNCWQANSDRAKKHPPIMSGTARAAASLPPGKSNFSRTANPTRYHRPHADEHPALRSDKFKKES